MDLSTDWCGYRGSDPLSFVFVVVVVVVDDIGLLVFCVLVGHFVLGLSLGGPIQWQSVQYPKMKPIKYYQGSTIAHGCLLPNLQASAFCIWDADRCSRYLAIVLGRTILGVPLKSSNPSRKLIETPWVKFWQPWWFPMIHDATNSERLQRDQGMIWMHPNTVCDMKLVQLVMQPVMKDLSESDLEHAIFWKLEVRGAFEVCKFSTWQVAGVAGIGWRF